MEQAKGAPFTQEEATYAIKRANKQSAPGHDGLPVRVIAMGGKRWAEMLTELFKV